MIANISLLRPGTSETIVFVHPITGTSWCYRNLLDGIHGDFRIFAIDAPGFCTDWHAPSMRDMPKLYATQILDIIGTGSCWICGYSLGGTLAIDVARELRTLGATIPPVIVFDPRRLDGASPFRSSIQRPVLTGIPKAHDPQPPHVWRYFIGVYFGWDIARWAPDSDSFLELDKLQRLQFLVSYAKENSTLAPWWDAKDVVDAYHFQVGLLHDASIYKLTPHSMPLVYFFAQDEVDHSYAIEFLALSGSGFRLRPCRGDHFTLMFDANNAALLGGSLTDAIQEHLAR
jgi:pimeloyl-ACP methyl ester carboxylesterase